MGHTAASGESRSLADSSGLESLLCRLLAGGDGCFSERWVPPP